MKNSSASKEEGPVKIEAVKGPNRLSLAIVDRLDIFFMTFPRLSLMYLAMLEKKYSGNSEALAALNLKSRNDKIRASRIIEGDLPSQDGLEEDLDIFGVNIPPSHKR